VAKIAMEDVSRAYEKGETEGFMKILVDAESKQILGASFLGTSGDEAIHCVLDTMYARAPYTTLRRAMHIHPTVSEFIPTMLEDLEPLQKYRSPRLSRCEQSRRRGSRPVLYPLHRRPRLPCDQGRHGIATLCRGPGATEMATSLEEDAPMQIRMIHNGRDRDSLLMPLEPRSVDLMLQYSILLERCEPTSHFNVSGTRCT